jgi:hypothetical protein
VAALKARPKEVDESFEIDGYEMDSYEIDSYAPRGRVEMPPKSSRLQSQNDARLYGGGIPTAMVRPPVIVECPSCSTSFTVSRAAIEGARGANSDTNPSNPTFHCSKCDSVFSKSLSELKDAPVRSAVSVSSGTVGFAGGFSGSAVAGRQLPLFGGIPGEGEFPSSLSTTAAPMNSASSNLATKLSYPPVQNDKAFSPGSISLKGVGEIKTSPLSDAPGVPPNSSELTPPLGQTRSFGRSQSVGHRGGKETLSGGGGFNFKKLSSGISAALPSLRDRSWSAGIFSKGAEETARKEPNTSETPSLFAMPGEFIPPAIRKLPLFAVAGPILAFLLLLGAATWTSMSVPELGRWMSDSWVARTDATLGRGLVLRGVRYSKVGLENGTQMGVISGSVYNGSGASVERATIEGVLFGRDGTELSRIKTVLGNRLSQAKIPTMTSDMIKDAQSERRARNVSVRPGEGYPFVMAIPLPRGAATFSARILNAR